MRDSINPAIDQNQALFVRGEFVEAGASFTAFNEWVQVRAWNPRQTVFGVSLITDSAQLLVGDEPFYVVGQQKFRLDTGTQATIYRAPRREMLSMPPARDYPNNGSAYSTVFDNGTFVSAAVPAGNWLVLGTDLVWRFSTSGMNVNGAVFGALAPDLNKRGRYYEIDFAATVDVGVCHLQAISSQFAGNWVGPAFSLNAVAPNGTVRVGDDNTAILTGPAYGVTTQSQTKIQGTESWTFAIQAGTAGAIITIHKLVVRRQGF